MMTKNLKVFFITFLISLPFWWGMNIFQKDLEDVLFWASIGNSSELLASQINQQIVVEPPRPARIEQVPEPSFQATSVLSILIKENGSQQVLFEKNSEEKLPIASLTKLMTVAVVLENYAPDLMIEISKNAVDEEQDIGQFKVGEKFTVQNLLYSLLIESSNDAAFALSEIIGLDNFVGLMNIKGAELDMTKTYFVNSTGLDPDTIKEPVDYSTAKDLAILADYLRRKDPQMLQITTLPDFDLFTPDNVFHHKIKNTNELLAGEGLGLKVLGSKTGWTPLAQGCLLMVFKAPKSNDIIINVILGSPDRFVEMKTLIKWLEEAYVW